MLKMKVHKMNMLDSPKFSSYIAILSLLVAIFSIGYTVWSNRKFRHLDALDEVRSIVIPSLARFNGILNSKTMPGRPFSPLSKKEAEALGKAYSDVRNAYQSRRYYFSESARERIDNKINTFEKEFRSNPEGYDFFTKMYEVMELIAAGAEGK